MTQTGATKSNHLAQVRDSVESVYVAIVLAFVLRAFMIEAFVIPTGSMANALYGDHYELTCPCCGWQYAFGRDQDSNPNNARCPNCFTRYGSVTHPKERFEPGGDRVLVMKFLYDFSPMQPWDVVVFKNPQNNRENYIKRLIGLPGEGIQIVQGDIFVSRDEGKTWNIRRKTPQAQRDMWLVLHNNDHPPMYAHPASSDLPPQWSIPQKAKASSPWNLKEHDGRVFRFAGADQPATIQFDPGRGQPGLGGYLPFNGYNDNTRRLGYDPLTDLCTDWKLSCVWRVESDAPADMDMTFAAFEDRFRATFHSDGTVRLLHQRRDAQKDDWQEWGRVNVGAFTPGEGRWIALQNVDYRVSVWVDGRCVIESTDEQYAGPSDGDQPAAERIFTKAMIRAKLMNIFSRNDLPTDLANVDPNIDPARIERVKKWFHQPRMSISARGGACTLWHIDAQRDVFYTQSMMDNPTKTDRPGFPSDCPIFDYFRELFALQASGKGSAKPFVPYDDPEENRGQVREYLFKSVGSMGHPVFLKDYEGRADLDEFFCLGDNSPQSHDGRSWNAAAPSLRLHDESGKPVYQLGTVPRYNMIGRAMLVYWPAGFRIPILDWPIVPNVGRIRLIR